MVRRYSRGAYRGATLQFRYEAARMRSLNPLHPRLCHPMHLHRKGAEHFVVRAGSYRIAIGEKIFEVSAGASITLPKGVPHSWRKFSSEPGAW
jgi:mannose-6-phosphate isomerase-like protein (cupin superfamily)